MEVKFSKIPEIASREEEKKVRRSAGGIYGENSTDGTGLPGKKVTISRSAIS